MHTGLPAKRMVLVVEDDPLLRMMAVYMVEDAGLDAMAAAGSEEAIHILERRDDVRLVFTDIDMPPGANGLWLAASIRARWPPIEIIVTSGKHSIDAADLPERGVFFAKPYDVNEITAAMRAMVL